MSKPWFILATHCVLTGCTVANPPTPLMESAPDPYIVEMQKNSALRQETCNAKHLKVGMGWRQIEKFCPGSPDQRVVTNGIGGETTMVVYKHYPGPTTVIVQNGSVSSVQLMEGY